MADAGPIGAAVREMEARRSAASGAAGGFTYAEFYRLLASAPPPPSLQSHSDGTAGINMNDAGAHSEDVRYGGK